MLPSPTPTRVCLLLRCRASAGGTGRGHVAGLGAAEIWGGGHPNRDLRLSFQRCRAVWPGFQSLRSLAGRRCFSSRPLAAETVGCWACAALRAAVRGPLRPHLFLVGERGCVSTDKYGTGHCAMEIPGVTCATLVLGRGAGLGGQRWKRQKFCPY